MARHTNLPWPTNADEPRYGKHYHEARERCLNNELELSLLQMAPGIPDIQTLSKRGRLQKGVDAFRSTED